MKQVFNITLMGLIFSVLFAAPLSATTPKELRANSNSGHSPSSATTEKPSGKNTGASHYTLNLLDQKGNKVTLEDLKGKVVFINFWATWCGPCIVEMPSIQKLYNSLKDNKDIAFVILEIEGNKSKATKFMETKKLDLPLYYPAGKIPAELFRDRLPTTVILDKQGKIAHIEEGLADYSGQDIVDFLNKLTANQH